jgi:type III restriction enzyme
MSQVVIENPIINSPFEEPARHFRFDEQGITNTIVPERRISQYFVPIAKPRKTAKERQMTFDEWTEDRIEENKTVNAIRRLIQLWREGRYTDDVTRTTARLLEYWQRDDRSRRLFFCQIEALETLIYITEVAKRYGHNWIENDLRRFNENANPDLLRIAAAQTLWVPAVNNAGTWGRWASVEIRDPWNSQSIIRGFLAETLMAEK